MATSQTGFKWTGINNGGAANALNIAGINTPHGPGYIVPYAPQPANAGIGAVQGGEQFIPRGPSYTAPYPTPPATPWTDGTVLGPSS